MGVGAPEEVTDVSKYDRSRVNRYHQGTWFNPGKIRAAKPVQPPPTDRRLGPVGMAVYYLAIWPHDVVRRATIRALLPAGYAVTKSIGKRGRDGIGGGSSTGNNITQKLKALYVELERDDLIRRDPETIRIVDRVGLLDRLSWCNFDDPVFVKARQTAETYVDEP
jgi:hypothetical protein